MVRVHEFCVQRSSISTCHQTYALCRRFDLRSLGTEGLSIQHHTCVFWWVVCVLWSYIFWSVVCVLWSCIFWWVVCVMWSCILVVVCVLWSCIFWWVICVMWSYILVSFVCEVVVVLFSGEFFVWGGQYPSENVFSYKTSWLHSLENLNDLLNIFIEFGSIQCWIIFLAIYDNGLHFIFQFFSNAKVVMKSQVNELAGHSIDKPPF